MHRQRSVRAERAEPVRPFHQHDASSGIVPTEFRQGRGAVHAPQVEMRHGAARRFIGLNKREAGAGNVQRGIAGQRAQEGAGEGGFARAEFAFQQNCVPHPHERGDMRGKMLCGGEVEQVDGKGVHLASVPRD